MSRPKEFDPTEVLDRAMQQFWETGFEGTSVQDLVDATGLNRSSLYETFGCKDELYLAALDRYHERETKRISRQLESRGLPLVQIRRVFEQAACTCEEGRGCFMVDATIERARHSEDTGRRAAASLRRLEDAFAGAVRHAQQRREVAASLDPAATGRFLANAYRGLHVTAKLSPERAALDEVIETTLAVLQPAALSAAPE